MTFIGRLFRWLVFADTASQQNTRRAVFIVAIFVGMGSGLVGYSEYDRRCGLESDFGQNFPATIFLARGRIDVRCETGPDGKPVSVPATLQFARVIAPIIFVLLILQSAFVVFVAASRRGTARWLRNHVIVFGETRAVDSLITSMVQAGTRTVAVRDQSARGRSAATAIANEGAIVLPPRPHQQQSLKSSGIAGAQTILAVSESDSENLDIALNSRSYLQSNARTNKQALTIHCRIGDVDLYRDITTSNFSNLSNRAVQVRYFCDTVERAKDAFSDIGWLDQFALSGCDTLDVVVIGANPLGQTILAQCASHAFHPEAVNRRLVLVDDDATKAEKAVMHRYPGLSNTCEAIFHDMPTGDIEAVIDTLQNKWSISPSVVFVTGPDDESVVAATLKLVAAIESGKWPQTAVRALAERAKGLELMVRDVRWFQNNSVDLRFCGDVSDVLSIEKLLSGRDDRLARTIHENYLAEFGSPGSGLDDWDLLAEQYKLANRVQAEAYRFWLALIGFRASAKPKPSLNAFSADDIQTISELEHQRWMSERVLTGWTYGDVRDNKRLKHPSIVPYEDLSEEEKDKDRAAVANIPANCLAAGLQILQERRIAAVWDEDEIPDSAQTFIGNLSIGPMEKLVVYSRLLSPSELAFVKHAAQKTDLAIVRLIAVDQDGEILGTGADTPPPAEIVSRIEATLRVPVLLAADADKTGIADALKRTLAERLAVAEA